MNGLPYYKAYPRDFIEGTIGMSFELKGAYRLVLDLIYMQGGMLPDDARYISGLLGCTVRKWNALRDQLIALDKIQVNGASLTNYRAVIELETLAKHQEKQRENASGPRKNKDLAKPPLRHTEPEPDTEKKEPPFKAPKGAKTKGSKLPDDWQPSEKHLALAESLGRTAAWMNDQAERMRGWAKANAHRSVTSKSDWNAAFTNWMKGNHEKSSPAYLSQAPPNGRGSLTDAAIELQHQTRRPRDEYPDRNIPLLARSC